MTAGSDACWIALTRVRGVGARVAHLLLDKFGDAPSIFAQREEDLVAAGVYRPTAKNIVQFANFEELEKELCKLARIGGTLVRWTDENYPANLRHIPDPPPCFYVRGALPAGENGCVAIVGARAASEAGLRMAQRLAMELALKRITVVSGLARGIDAQAHRGALEGNG